MFHWICPECGRELAPTVKQCAACDPAAQPAPVVKAVAEPPAIIPEILGQFQGPSGGIIPALTGKAAVANSPAGYGGGEPYKYAETALAEPTPEAVLDSLLILAEQIRAAQQEEPVVVQPARCESLAVPAAAPRISITQFFPKTEAIALLAPPETLAPPAPVDLRPAAAEPAPQPAKPEPPAEPASAPVIKELKAPPRAEQPPSGSWLELAPLQNYTTAATRAMQPAAPSKAILAPDSGPRITLPGPALPPELESLKDASVVTVIAPRQPRSALPGWLVSTMLMLGIPIAGGALLLYLQPLQRSSAENKAPAAVVADAPVAAVAAPAPVTHSLADYVEVTGFRFAVDLNKKSEIHYLVVNHSPAELSDMTLYVTLRAVDAKAGQPPLCRFSFRAQGLGPYASKEMTSAIEKLTRPVSLPDWQDLRADVQIGQ